MALTDLQPQIPLDPVAIGDLVTSPRSNANDIEFASGGHVDLSPLVTRTISLGQASDELAAFDRPAPPGVAVITDFLT